MNTAGENRRATFNVVIIWLRDQDKRGSEDNNSVMCQLAVVCGGVCEALYNVHSGFEVSVLLCLVSLINASSVWGETINDLL